MELRDGAIHGGPTLLRGVDGFLGIESIFHAQKLAQLWIPHLTLSSIAHWGTCLGLAPCLVLDSVQRTSRSLDNLSLSCDMYTDEWIGG